MGRRARRQQRSFFLEMEPMKPPPKRLSDLKGTAHRTETYAAPTPMVSRQKRAKVLTAAERAAFLASRPDLKPKT
jgi:hypothetical protein